MYHIFRCLLRHCGSQSLRCVQCILRSHRLCLKWSWECSWVILSTRSAASFASEQPNGAEIGNVGCGVICCASWAAVYELTNAGWFGGSLEYVMVSTMWYELTWIELLVKRSFRIRSGTCWTLSSPPVLFCSLRHADALALLCGGVRLPHRSPILHAICHARLHNLSAAFPWDNSPQNLRACGFTSVERGNVIVHNTRPPVIF